MTLEENRRPRVEGELTQGAVALFDVDNTLVSGFTIFQFADHLVTQYLFYPSQRERMNEDYEEYKKDKNYRKFAINVVENYSQGLAGFSQEAVEREGVEFLSKYETSLYSYTRELVRIMNNRGKTIAISGAPKEAFEPMARRLGIQETHLLEAEVQDGIYTGRTKVNMALDGEKKKVVAQIKTAGYNTVSSFAFGDSIHDRPILEEVDNTFVIKKLPEDEDLKKLATERGWPIVAEGEVLREVNKRIGELSSNS